MKSKKKIISLAIILGMSAMMILSGCGSKENSDSDDSSAKVASTEEVSEKVFEKGTLTDTSFESSYLNLKFDLPEGYIMQTEEELLQVTSAGADIMDIDEEYLNATTVYEMMVSAPAGTPNAIVMEEKLAMDNMTEEQYIAQVKVGLMSMDVIAYDIEEENKTVSIAGQDYLSFSATCEANGVSMIQEYFTRKIGDRMASIIVSYSDDTVDGRDALMDSFTEFE